MILCEILLWNEGACHDGQQFHQYQQNKQSPLTSKSLTTIKTRTSNVGNPGTGLGEAPTRILMTGKTFVKALHLWDQSEFINIDSNLTALFNQIPKSQSNVQINFVNTKFCIEYKLDIYKQMRVGSTRNTKAIKNKRWELMRLIFMDG
jgi:hypothetical protein